MENSIKKWNVLALLILISYCWGCAPTPNNPSTTPSSAPEQPPFIQNPGFEYLESSGQPVGWSLLPEKWSIDSNIVHSGKYSLRVQNNDTSWYHYPYQEIFVVPGKSYQIGLWIKGEDFTHKDPNSSGAAAFCIEYFGADGTWLGGKYDIPRLQENSDWQHLILKEIIIPSRWLGREVAHINLPLLLTEGSAGSAWFDDFSIEELKPPLLETYLLKPNYRGILVSNTPLQIQVQTSLHTESEGLILNDLELRLLLETSNAEIIQEAVFTSIDNSDLELILEVPEDLPEGTYILRIQLLDKLKKNLLAETIEQLKYISPSVQNNFPAYIDQSNRLLCRGTPFFPLGIYTANAELPVDYERIVNIKKIADSPFDTLLNYNTLALLNWGYGVEECYNLYILPYLNLLHEHNLRVLCGFPTRNYFNLPDPTAVAKIQEIVNTLKNHPAILGWYLNDEIGPSYFPQLLKYYQAVRDEDPNHPVWSVLYRLHNLKRLAPTTDIIGVNPYPVPHTPLVYVAEAAEAAKEAGRQARPFWIVIQAHGPSRQEVRCMTYLGLIRQASGIFYYSFFDLWKLHDADARWEWLKKIGEEVKILRPILLSIDEIPASGITCDQPAVHFLLKRYQEHFYLLLTNSSETERIQAKFQGNAQVPFTESIVDFLLEENLQEIENESFFAVDNQLTVTLAPLEAQVYKWPVMTNKQD